MGLSVMGLLIPRGESPDHHKALTATLEALRHPKATLDSAARTDEAPVPTQSKISNLESEICDQQFIWRRQRRRGLGILTFSPRGGMRLRRSCGRVRADVRR